MVEASGRVIRADNAECDHVRAAALAAKGGMTDEPAGEWLCAELAYAHLLNEAKPKQRPSEGAP